MIRATIAPKRLKLFAVVLLHHHSSEERSNEQDGEGATYTIGPPVHTRHEVAHKGQEEHKHKGNNGRRQDAIYKGVDNHLTNQYAPVTVLAMPWMAQCNIVQSTHPRLGHTVLEKVIAWHREAYHIRGEEGGDN